MRNTRCKTSIMVEKIKNVENESQTLQAMNTLRKLKNVENETQTLFDLEYGEKHSKT